MTPNDKRRQRLRLLRRRTFKRLLATGVVVLGCVLVLPIEVVERDPQAHMRGGLGDLDYVSTGTRTRCAVLCRVNRVGGDGVSDTTSRTSPLKQLVAWRAFLNGSADRVVVGGIVVRDTRWGRLVTEGAPSI